MSKILTFISGAKTLMPKQNQTRQTASGSLVLFLLRMMNLKRGPVFRLIRKRDPSTSLRACHSMRPQDGDSLVMAIGLSWLSHAHPC